MITRSFKRTLLLLLGISIAFLIMLSLSDHSNLISLTGTVLNFFKG